MGTVRLLAALAALLAAFGTTLAQPLPGQREAAEAGDPRAQFAIALMYDTGADVPTDYLEALKWFRLSAEGGYPPGQAKLGLMYLFGWAVRRDPAEAASWYEKAASQGHERAQAQIGAMYARGQGVPKNAVFAYLWTSLSAAAGNAESARKRDVLARKMTADELAEAETLVRAWRPRR